MYFLKNLRTLCVRGIHARSFAPKVVLIYSDAVNQALHLPQPSKRVSMFLCLWRAGDAALTILNGEADQSPYHVSFAIRFLLSNIVKLKEVRKPALEHVQMNFEEHH
ncbi:hypothetical protein A3C20_04120 [Candidatus Kaiserbacteria bacterium RIFCSPHIGHO2_02_FULL_55_25]|uniref:Uncharacterized protein n=1 Tax=Candidatus Kaiserbacteria bacterium RIFCSPHIGHO2_02_FULL_55_25 TaxID=1798498 RepID=A0A1F6EAS5_9BACT|nr:MAG: hypothetical protein A2764_00935 [Candidatus Kaiserbacteria bacterium RIFCSPHIGHO2_01_FULL_55_79]OGG70680.1 MAG: hypothetical protein A3C20_04120 [Candidatus Kaiserbacteria bacterium RIFCSPHIGHO2_02_FULL_55_25]OGG77985.1 MAG: hypothetical protein A3F56_02820 [Candidatus Kaiserbacteria bacterium RIFCSPHIGHO2_12_FULL_55_13]OGG83983.1 MAG: hypothetical protein A3A42_02960 [Candidatus Kaiserbacteria bacterium RIFCSPLOWO2_01_FULL_55_25]